ncbi:MAG: hypothetical protein ACI8Z1_002515, partial [Candidatus Azotimanducaceae bacterium]
GEIGPMLIVNIFNQCFGRGAKLFGAKHGCRAVGVVSADIDALMALHALEPNPDIRLDVFHQVSEVN